MGNGLLSYSFWHDALERAVKTAAESLLAVIGLNATFDVFAPDVATWWAYLGVALGGAFVSILTSIASHTRTGTASLISDANARVVEQR